MAKAVKVNVMCEVKKEAPIEITTPFWNADELVAVGPGVITGFHGGLFSYLQQQYLEHHPEVVKMLLMRAYTFEYMGEKQ